MPIKTLETPDPGVVRDNLFSSSPIESLREIFVVFVQQLFAAAPKGLYHYDPADDVTEIIIRDENPINVETIGMRPAINFVRGPMRWQRMGIGDMHYWDEGLGKQVRSALLPLTISINCSARKDLESERLAFIVSEHIVVLREHLIGTKIGIYDVGMPEIGSPSPAGAVVAGDSGDEWYTTAVTVPVTMFRTSQSTELNKRILTNITTALDLLVTRKFPQEAPTGPSAQLPFQDNTVPKYGLTQTPLDSNRVPARNNPAVTGSAGAVGGTNVKVTAVPFPDRRVSPSPGTAKKV